MDLAGEEHHRIALSRALRVPEHAEPAVSPLSVAHGLDGPVDSEKLVVLRENLLRLSRGIVEDDEVLEKIEEVRLRAHSHEQRFHIHGARLVFGEAFPVVKVFESGARRSYLRIDSVGQHHKGVVVEEMRHGIHVVHKVFLERDADILRDVLQLHEQQRQAVDEADNIRPAAVEVAPDPELPNTHELVVFGGVEIEQPQATGVAFAPAVPERNLHAVPDQLILFPVGREERPARVRRDDLPRRFVVRLVRKPRIQLRQFRPQSARQDDLPVGSSSQKAPRSEVLVVGVYGLPAQSFEVFGRGPLDERLFGIPCGHREDSFRYRSERRLPSSVRR